MTIVWLTDEDYVAINSKDYGDLCRHFNGVRTELHDAEEKVKLLEKQLHEKDIQLAEKNVQIEELKVTAKDAVEALAGRNAHLCKIRKEGFILPTTKE